MAYARFFVTDYDFCAFSATSERDDKLSQAIIDKAKSQHYDGFYACTHRSYSDIDLVRRYALRAGTKLGFDKKAIQDNSSTYKITANFENATQLPLMAVSTLDDIYYPTPGTAYTAILEPYEKEAKKAERGAEYLSKLNVLRHSTSKNYQLTQIARHAAENYPKVTVILDYFDDFETLCNSAKTVMQEKKWPGNVYLNIYHYENGNIKTIQEPDVFFDVEEEFFSDTVSHDSDAEETSVLRRNSIFAGSSRPPSPKPPAPEILRL